MKKRGWPGRLIGFCFGIMLCGLVACGPSFHTQAPLLPSSPAQAQLLSQAQQSGTADSGKTATETDSDGETTNTRETETRRSSVPVTLDGKTLFIIQAPLGPLTPVTRARDASQRLAIAAQNYALKVEDIEVVDLDGIKLIQAGDVMLAAVGSADAAAAETTPSALANERAAIIRRAIAQYRQTRAPREIFIAAIKALGSTVVVLLLFWLLTWITRRIFRRIDIWQERRMQSVRFQRLEFLSGQQVKTILHFIINLIRGLLIFLILYIYLPLVLSFFPWTRALGNRLLYAFWGAVDLAWDAFIVYLPNLFTITIICVAAYYTIRFGKVIFNALGSGLISVPWFYREWAEPTQNLFTVMILALAAVLIFPNLPGANSPAFQGISIFIGALITLGSTTAIANVVGGVIQIYTRAFQVGDRITVAGVTGDVIEKTILSTRIRTINNVAVTIPNSSLIANDIGNYSALLREMDTPLILNTTITLGYDLPWRKVHQTLIAAALATEHILKDPAPFVLQTSLNDFYVSYELKAYTREPKLMASIYSELHQNIQDKCNENDIEILSPHYSALRDGNPTTIPAHYLPDSYNAPGFRIDNLKG